MKLQLNGKVPMSMLFSFDNKKNQKKIKKSKKKCFQFEQMELF